MSQPRTMARRPTQIDVARLARVSQPVVSYVLGGAADAPVAPETRDRVLAAIAELGYVPDRTARNLRRRRTATLAGIIPDITNPYYPAFVRGVQDVAEIHRLDLITYNTDGDGGKERKALRSAREGRVEGVIVTPFHLELADLLPLVADGIALVVNGEVGFDPTPAGIDQILTDNAAAAEYYAWDGQVRPSGDRFEVIVPDQEFSSLSIRVGQIGDHRLTINGATVDLAAMVAESEGVRLSLVTRPLATQLLGLGC